MRQELRLCLPLPIAAPAAPWDREGLLFPEGHRNANILAKLSIKVDVKLPPNSVLAALIYFMLLSFPCTYIDRNITTVKGIRGNGAAHPRVLTELHTPWVTFLALRGQGRKRVGR